jgi:hypothetical protein
VSEKADENEQVRGHFTSPVKWPQDLLTAP